MRKPRNVGIDQDSNWYFINAVVKSGGNLVTIFQNIVITFCPTAGKVVIKIEFVMFLCPSTGITDLIVVLFNKPMTDWISLALLRWQFFILFFSRIWCFNLWVCFDHICIFSTPGNFSRNIVLKWNTLIHIVRQVYTYILERVDKWGIPSFPHSQAAVSFLKFAATFGFSHYQITSMFKITEN